MITEKAYAKINLFLNVTSTRPDGYHDIESVMHTVDLCDTVTVDAKDSARKISLVTNSPLLSDNKKNLAYIAAEKYLTKYNIDAEVAISLDKKIPIGAGLGGGSSDAAATLRALNGIFCAATPEELSDIALSVGSDVPFCLTCATAHCLGRGEIMTPIVPKRKMNFVIAIGKSRTSTPEAYRKLDELYLNSGFPNESELCKKMCSRLVCGENIGDCVYNIFEKVTEASDVAKIKNIMIKSGAEAALMSGSGPSVFGAFVSEQDSLRALSELVAHGYTAFASRSV